MQGFIIIGSSLVVTLLFTLLPGLRYLRQALTANTRRVLFPILAFVSTFLGSSHGADLTAGIPDPLRLVRVALLIALALAALFPIMQQLGTVVARAGAGARWMAIYAMFAMLSATWSVGPILSLWKGFEVLALVIVVVAIAGRLRTLEDLQWLHRLMALIFLFLCFTVLMGLAIFPAEAMKDSESRFAVRGLVLLFNPGSVGAVGGLLAVLMAATLLHADPARRNSRAGIWVSFGIGILTMLLAHARTPMFACIAAILLLLVYARRWRLLAVTAALGVILLAATALEDVLLNYIYRGQSTAQFTALTGRIATWEIIWPQIIKSPIIGQGYYSAQRMIFNVSTVDNTYLEVLFGIGIVGLVIFIVPILWAGFRIYASRPTSGHITLRNSLWLGTAGMFALIVIRGLAGPSFETLHPLLIVYLLTQISVAVLIRTRTSSIPQANSRHAPQQKQATGIHASRQPAGVLGRRDPHPLTTPRQSLRFKR